MFYISHNVKFNLKYLKNKLNISLGKDTSKYTINTIKELLKEKFIESNFNSIRNDIIPFVDTDYNVDSIDKSMFINSIDYLECQ